EVGGRKVDAAGLDHLELGLAAEHLDQVAFELLLDVDVAPLEALRLLLRLDLERRELDRLAPLQVQAGALRQLELHLDRRGGCRQGGEDGESGERPRLPELPAHLRDLLRSRPAWSPPPRDVSAAEEGEHCPALRSGARVRRLACRRPADARERAACRSWARRVSRRRAWRPRA